MENVPQSLELALPGQPGWWRKKWWWLALVVALVTLFVSGPSWRLAFLSDDYDWITRAEQNIKSGDVFQPLRTKIGGNFYRPLPAISFTIDSTIGHRNVIIFHIHQLLLLFALAMSIGWLLWLLFQRWSLAAITALLFAAYPSHHEVVTWLAGRPDLLAALWMVVSSAALIKYLTTNRGWWLTAVSISTALALLSKESALVIPAIHLGIIGWYKIQHRETAFSRLIIAWLPSVILLMGLLVVRGFILTDAIGGYRLGGQNIGIHIPLRSWLAPFTSFGVLVNLPYWSSVAKDPLSTLLTHHFRGLLIVGGLLFASLLPVTGLIRRETRWIFAPLIFALAWLIITFIPTLGLASAIGSNLEGSRLFFTPSVGYCLLWASLLAVIISRQKIAGLTLSVLLVFSFGLLSIFNLQPWHRASQTVNNISRALAQNRDTLLPVELTDVVVNGLPGKTYGAYEFWGPHIVEAVVQAAAQRELGVFVGGSGRFANSPFCRSTNPAPQIGVLRWKGSTKTWGRETVLENKIASSRTNVQVLPTAYWQSSDMATTSFGAYVTSDQSALQTILPNIDGAAVRGLVVNLTDIQDASVFGSRRATIDWAVDGVYDPSRHLSYTIPAGHSSYTIPLCEYMNWSLADRITSIKLRPLQAGSFKLISANFSATREP